MANTAKTFFDQNGFTLVEMAVVLVIVGLLLAGLLAPLSAQRDMKDYGNARISLEQAKEALYGYALSHAAMDGNPYLPCPDVNDDGYEDRAGSACSEYVGGLPTGDLGLQRTDSWNNAYRYRVTPDFADSSVGFTLSTLGNITVLDSNGGNTVVSAIPALILSRGKNGGAAPVSADEIENIDPDAIFVSREYTTTFDDIVLWLSSSILMNRMVTAGQLP